MFYGGVVVEVGVDVLGSHRTQGFVTQRVTNSLNVAGAVALAVWDWDVAAGRRTGGRLWVAPLDRVERAGGTSGRSGVAPPAAR